MRCPRPSAMGANLRPFGAPPSIGRREKSESLSLEGKCVSNRWKMRVPLFPYCHFERSEKSSLHTGQTKEVRGAVNTVLHTTWNDRLPYMYYFPACKKDPSAALGMTRYLSCISSYPAAGANLRPFGAPPSIGRRECPREPLPLEGAAERSEAGLASFFAAKPPPLCLSYWGRLFLYLRHLDPSTQFSYFQISHFFNTRRFSPLRMTKCAVLPPQTPNPEV